MAILSNRATLREGYGLPVHPGDSGKPATPHTSAACGEDICSMQERQRRGAVKSDACA